MRVEIKSFIIPGKTLNFLIKLCSYCQNILRKSLTPPKVKILRICTLLFFQHFSEFTDHNIQGKNKSYISLHKKMKFSIKDFFSKCDQIRNFLCFLRIWVHLLKKSLIENFIFCTVHPIHILLAWYEVKTNPNDTHWQSETEWWCNQINCVISPGKNVYKTQARHLTKIRASSITFFYQGLPLPQLLTS